MACDQGYKLWNFLVKNDRTGDSTILLFCLKEETTRVTGTVTDKDEKPISSDKSVTGMRFASGADPVGFMSLSFAWDNNSGEPIRVFMVGTVSVNGVGVRIFNGRFVAYVGEAPASAGSGSLVAGPDDGDIGTGSGTQT